MGEQRLPVVPETGNKPCDMVFQATNVTKALGSVKNICLAGHAVIFMEGKYGGSHIIDLEFGDFNTMTLREEDGNYVLDAWIPPPVEGDSGRVDEENEEEPQMESTFARQP